MLGSSSSSVYGSGSSGSNFAQNALKPFGSPAGSPPPANVQASVFAANGQGFRTGNPPKTTSSGSSTPSEGKSSSAGKVRDSIHKALFAGTSDLRADQTVSGFSSGGFGGFVG